MFARNKPVLNSALMQRAFSVSSVAVLVLTVGTAQAAEAKDPVYRIVGSDSIDPAALSSGDAPDRSEMMGISEVLVQDEFADQDEFNLAIASIKESDPGRYSAAVWDPTPEYRGTVSFKGEPSTEALQVIQNLPFPVLVATNAPATAVELETALEDSFHDLADSDGVVNVSGWVNEESGIIDLEYSTGTISKSAAINNKIQLIANSSPIEIRITQAANAGGKAEIVRGGMAMGACTSGFTVFTNNARGVLTAGHCTNSSTYVTGSSTATRFVSEHRGSYGDFQWHSTPDTTSNYIRISSSGTTRAITRQAIAAVGTSVCNYGKMRSSSSCTTVKSTSACVTDQEGYRLCRLVTTNGAFTQPGDSGGPWYAGNTAYGIHFGKVSGKSAYSRIGNAEAILGVITKIN